MSRFKYLAKFFVIWGVIFLVFIASVIFQDIKENKLLNYTETYATSDVSVKSEYKPLTSLKYVFRFTAHDDYLGSISFKYFRLKDNPGQVVFRIKEAIQSDWHAENRYDFSYFNNDDSYQFGFPEIIHSRDKQFDFEFEIVTPNLSRNPNFLDLKNAPILTAKYVFPRNTYYKSLGKLANILFNRTKAVIVGMNHVKVGIASFIIAIFSFLVFYRQESGAKFHMKTQQKDLQKKALVINSWIGKINFFFIPGGVLAILSLAFISGNFLLAERMSVYLWITLLGSVIFYIVQVTILNKLNVLGKFIDLISINTLSTLDDLMTKKTLIILGILVIIISGLSSTYYLGGDDSRLFYLYPQEFLNNYASKIVSDTGASQLTNFIPPSSLSAFLIIMIGLKDLLPGVNLQAFLNTANIVGGFFAFFYLVSYLLRPSGKYERVICILASFMYVFSIFNFYTLFNSRLIAEYLISLFPLSLYLGIKATREGKFYLLVAAVLIWSVFSFVSVTVPLSAAALITSLPLLVFATWKYKGRLAVYLTAAGLIFAVLNLHWFTYIPYSNFIRSLPGSSASSLTSTEFRKSNAAGIRQVSEINNSFFPLLNSYHQKIQFDFHWPQLPIYLSWYSKILISGYLFIATVIVAGLVIERGKPRTGLYIAAVINFVTAVYFFTVNISPFGISIFLWLSDHIPACVIIRNMYDKFAYGLAFQWALIIAISLTVVIKSLGASKYKAYLLCLVFLIAVINAKPFILGEFTDLPYWTTKHSYDGIHGLNRDYLEMVEFIKSRKSVGRYLSLPLLTGNSVIIQDEFHKDHYYAGVSPLLLLTGKNDMSGLISFAGNAGLVFNWLEEKNYDRFGSLLQQYNVKYVIVNNATPEDLQNSFMFSDGLFALQTKEFYKNIIGKKIKDFGSKYSLYEINRKYISEKIYISDSPTTFFNQGAKLSFKKNASYSYAIEIANLSDPLSLVFLDPYLKEWQLLSPSGKQLVSNNHHLVFDYANLWEINPQDIKRDLPASDYHTAADGSLQINLKLYFQPHDYFVLVNIISSSAYLICMIYIIKSLWHSKKK